MLNRTLCVVALAASSLLTACGADTVARTGFIPKSVPMSKVDGDTSSYKAKGFELSQFGKVVVEPIQGPPTNEGKIEPKDMEDLRARFQTSLQKSLEATGGKGDRTLVVRASITALKPNKPLLNAAPQTQILKRGYGYAACEIYATDGKGGQTMAAWMNTQDTQRFGTEKLSELGTAQKACETWGPAFREFLTATKSK